MKLDLNLLVGVAGRDRRRGACRARRANADFRGAVIA
jgi:hypothetical protein